MDRYHLFFDADNRAIVIEDHPLALDEAPYDRIVRRYGPQPVEPMIADLVLKKHGGIAIYADGREVSIAPD